MMVQSNFSPSFPYAPLSNRLSNCVSAVILSFQTYTSLLNCFFFFHVRQNNNHCNASVYLTSSQWIEQICWILIIFFFILFHLFHSVSLTSVLWRCFILSFPSLYFVFVLNENKANELLNCNLNQSKYKRRSPNRKGTTNSKIDETGHKEKSSRETKTRK